MIEGQKGQVVVLLLLVMAIALAVSLSAISRSILEVSTSRKSEDSSRAFSAAEAGIERAIQANLNTLGGAPVAVAPINFSTGNQAGADITVSAGGLPLINMGLSYPPFGKESFAQFWLINPSSSTIVPSYTAPSFDIYFGAVDPDGTKYVLANGGNPQDKPAIEVSTIYWNGSKYMTFVKYFDSFDGMGTNVRSSGFSSCTGMNQIILVNNNKQVSFYCKVNVSGYPAAGNFFPVMVRVRILYSNLSHPVAIKGVGQNIPKQANIYQSSGTSGDVRRTLEVFNQKSVMPQLFDYVLFSAAQLQK